MGGVQLLYYGNRHRLFQKMWDEIDGFSRRLNGGQVYSRFGAAEALLYGEKIRQLGVEYDPCCLACGVEAHDGRIDGVLFVDEERVFTVCARNVVDATGDGDLARLAGIPMETGDRATGGVQNYSQLYRFSGTEYDRAGGDPDTMHPEVRSEWARALTQDLCACAEYDMVEMLTVRESSRIVGGRADGRIFPVRSARPVLFAARSTGPDARTGQGEVCVDSLPQPAVPRGSEPAGGGEGAFDGSGSVQLLQDVRRRHDAGTPCGTNRRRGRGSAAIRRNRSAAGNAGGGCADPAAPRAAV